MVSSRASGMQGDPFSDIGGQGRVEPSDFGRVRIRGEEFGCSGPGGCQSSERGCFGGSHRENIHDLLTAHVSICWLLEENLRQSALGIAPPEVCLVWFCLIMFDYWTTENKNTSILGKRVRLTRVALHSKIRLFGVNKRWTIEHHVSPYGSLWRPINWPHVSSETAEAGTLWLWNARCAHEKEGQQGWAMVGPMRREQSVLEAEQ